jgi:hypothetical protein
VIPLPKLDIVTIDILLCGVDRCIVVGAVNVDAAHDMVVVANDVNSIIVISAPFAAGSSDNYRSQELKFFCPVPGSIALFQKLGH